MITAIFVLVLVSTVLLLMLNLSTQSAKSTVDIYLKEQTALVARSATEYAMLAVSGHDNGADCIETINLDYGNYDVNMSLHYLGNALPCSAGHILDNTVQTTSSNATVIIDTTVTFDAGNGEEVSYFRRTLQKL